MAKQTREQRKGYTIYANRYSRDDVPSVEVFDCVITPSRIAVYREGETRGAMFFAPNQVPSTRLAWSEQDAWVRFLESEQKRVARLREDVRHAEAGIAVAEQKVLVTQ